MLEAQFLENPDKFESDLTNALAPQNHVEVIRNWEKATLHNRLAVLRQLLPVERFMFTLRDASLSQKRSVSPVNTIRYNDFNDCAASEYLLTAAAWIPDSQTPSLCHVPKDNSTLFNEHMYLLHQRLYGDDVIGRKRAQEVANQFQANAPTQRCIYSPSLDLQRVAFNVRLAQTLYWHGITERFLHKIRGEAQSTCRDLMSPQQTAMFRKVDTVNDCLRILPLESSHMLARQHMAIRQDVARSVKEINLQTLEQELKNADGAQKAGLVIKNSDRAYNSRYVRATLDMFWRALNYLYPHELANSDRGEVMIRIIELLAELNITHLSAEEITDQLFAIKNSGVYTPVISTAGTLY